MKKFTFLFLLFIASISFAQTVFINEIHYDNSGSDTDEAIEVAGPANTDLSTYSLVLYNGSNGTEYNTTALSGMIPDSQNGFGVVNFPISGIQNGSPDGIALVNNGTDVIQFLSYEGDLTATDGPAMGMVSTDIGVSEAGSTPVGESLQLSGTGSGYTDFTWSTPATSTAGSVNTGQTFDGTLSLERNDTKSFSIAPNPSTGVINISTKGNDITGINVYNLLGDQVFSQKSNTTQVDLSNLAAGMYVVEVNQNGKSTSKKLILN